MCFKSKFPFYVDKNLFKLFLCFEKKSYIHGQPLNPRKARGVNSTEILETSRLRNITHLEFGHRVCVNSPMSIPVSLATFLDQLGARFNFGGPGNAQDRKIWNFRKFKKSTFLALK